MRYQIESRADGSAVLRVVSEEVECRTAAEMASVMARYAGVRFEFVGAVPPMGESSLEDAVTGATSVVGNIIREARQPDTAPPPAAPESPKPDKRAPGTRAGIDWDTVEDLGKVPHSVIAQRLGVRPYAVECAAKARGLRAPAPVPRPPVKVDDDEERKKMLDEHIRTKGVTKVVVKRSEPDAIPAAPRAKA